MFNQGGMRVLTIDLSRRKIAIERRQDLLNWLGGVGVATQLLKEHLKPELDPFHPDQPIILAIGPMSTVYPVVTKAVAMFKSPLTGELGESYAGLRIAMAMRFAGYDAIVIKGKAESPAYLTITPHQVDFNDARALWGLSTEETGRLLRQLSPGKGHRSTLRIGQAGEKLVAYAGVNVDTYRHFGRLGLGAVFGSKNLKAIVVHGDHNYPIARPQEYQRVYSKIFKKVVETDIMEKYHGLGTTGNVEPLNEMGGLPVRNLQASSYPEALNLSGETFAQETLIRKIACAGCPVGCIHIGIHRRQFAEGYEYESVAVSYDHELVYALGTMLGLTDHRHVYALIERTELYGLDSISTGVALAWATEAQEKGLIGEEELLTHLAFGQPEPYLQAMDYLIKQPNEFYRTLAQGTWLAAERYGGTEFACVLGKNEVAGYHTGYANILGQAFGARHSHLDNGGYAIDQERKDRTPEELVDAIIQEEEIRNTLNSLVICLFARKVYDLATVAEGLKALGHEWTEEQLRQLGREIYREKMVLKRQLGFKLEQITVPRRFWETPALGRQLDPEKMEQLRQIMIGRLSQL
ncbi:aldehyde ferredoxin oxidoreductase family protein [Carboxydocella sp. ULO1]|uniref:aldehyde ferredoxin oxidoreductase family protein n=1 Tax=Carboxydocella sp. ULO1 TaxID=1926599 RepID=UPI0009AE8F87|nr:aldehyde ferredoxin oxidoreductase family protein [Carboxydocella sp. ULO1]GAW28521.1 aldehyde ferredoxin oxidoreductase [Carboxydocella sp. ULO1]